MVIHSLLFLFGVLPVLLVLYFAASRMHLLAALTLLIGASVVIYAINDLSALLLLCVSLLVNYAAGVLISRAQLRPSPSRAKSIFIAGIVFNVSVLAFYKYFPDLFALLAIFRRSAPHALPTISFPLALSFITFSQLSFLIELFTAKITLPSFLRYCFYVLFFPKLFAGPIARPSEILPQLSAESLSRRDTRSFLKGLSFLSIGLFKKAAIADSLAPVVAFTFNVAHGEPVTFYRAWFGTLAYSFQIYFDFSGYSDIAIGLALLFGVILPLNFSAPYRATNISEFWRRWHSSLYSFFRDFIYIPLGGNRKGTCCKISIIFLVFLLVGIWHGSGITFVLWGILQGAYMAIHQLWICLRKRLCWEENGGNLWRLFATMLTFMSVTVAWTVFRAESLSSAMRLLAAMFHLPARFPHLLEVGVATITLLPPLVIVFFLPTTQRWLRYQPVFSAEVSQQNDDWLPTFWRGVLVGSLALCSVVLLSQMSMFIYQGF